MGTDMPVAMLSGHPRIAFWVAVVLTLAVGTMDFLSGRYVAVDLFYLMPIAIAGWFARRRDGLVIAAFATAVSFSADWTMHQEASHWTFIAWNVLVKFGMFSVTAVLLGLLKRQQRELAEQAHQDPLTCLSNRRGFHHVAQREMDRSRRYGSSFAVAYLDIDNFKAVNDRLGHEAGDRLLRLVARTLREHSRNVDEIARLGGDEFALLLPETTCEEARHTLEKIHGLLTALMYRHNLPVTFSIGAMTYALPPQSLNALLASVDGLMYSVKRRGKNAIAFGAEDVLNLTRFPVSVAALNSQRSSLREVV
jgi:diguanylate cyclase (GGDEF)-like protein